MMYEERKTTHHSNLYDVRTKLAMKPVYTSRNVYTVDL